MDGNAGSLFSKENPFTKNAKSRAFYYPSLEVKGLSKEKNIVLQPEYEKRPGKTASTGNAMELVNAIEESLSNDQKITDGIMDNASGSSKYDESWSSTLPSFQETPVKQVGEPKIKQKEHSVEDFIERQSTLSRFVQRFREQPPLPRQTREEKSSDTTPEFWWLQNQKFCTTTSTPIDQFPNVSSSLSSTPPCSRQNTRNHNKPQRRLSNSTDDVGGMQVRADKLLEMSGTTLNNDTSTTLSRISCIQKGNHQRVKENPWEIPKHAAAPSTLKYPLKPKRPEDDILYQWRLARKMEMAAEHVNKPFKGLSANFTSKRDYARKEIIEKLRTNEICKTRNGTKEVETENMPESTDKQIRKNKEKFAVSDHNVKMIKEVAVETENSVESADKQTERNNNKLTENNANSLREEFIRNNPHLVGCVCGNIGTNFMPPCLVHPHIHTVCQGWQHQLTTHQQHQQQQQYSPTKVSTTSTGIQVSLPSENSTPILPTSKNHIIVKSTKKENQMKREVRKAERPYTQSKEPFSLEQTRTKARGPTEITKTKNPVINQVIAHHLFPDDDESERDSVDDERPSFTPSPSPSCHKTSPPPTIVEHPSRPTASTPTKADDAIPTRENEVIDEVLQTQTADDMFDVSSEDEFVEDEILQDLRKRRKNIRQKLRELQNILMPS